MALRTGFKGAASKVCNGIGVGLALGKNVLRSIAQTGPQQQWARICGASYRVSLDPLVKRGGARQKSPASFSEACDIEWAGTPKQQQSAANLRVASVRRGALQTERSTIVKQKSEAPGDCEAEERSAPRLRSIITKQAENEAGRKSQPRGKYGRRSKPRTSIQHAQ